MVKKVIISLTIVLVFLVSFGIFGITNASNLKIKSEVNISENDEIESMLMTAGMKVNISGKVDGDVYCAGNNVIVSGTINGDLICASKESLSITGTVYGDIRVIGKEKVSINGTTSGSVTVIGENVTIGKDSSTGRDMIITAGTTTVDGSINRDLVINSANATINGEVGRKVNGIMGELTVGSTAKIQGELDYSSNIQPSIKNSNSIIGVVTVRSIDINKEDRIGSWLFSIASFALIFALIGAALSLVQPKIFDKLFKKIKKDTIEVSILGSASIIITPVIMAALVCILVGIPLAMIIAAIWMTVALLSFPITGYSIGRSILKDSVTKPVWYMLAGVSVLAILVNIPIIGSFIVLVSYVIGAGALISYIKPMVRKTK